MHETSAAEEPPGAQKPRPLYKPPTSIPSGASEQARQRKTYASFGNDGVTASVNAYGNLMQITRYFHKESNDPSGFFCAEFSEIRHAYPYHALERLRDITSASGNPYNGMYLRLGGTTLHDNKAPHLSFVHNRWPCFEQQSSAMDYTIQYLVHGKTVYQMYTFQLDEKARTLDPPDVSVNFKMHLLNMNFTENNDGFEERLSEQQQGETQVEYSASDSYPSSDDDSLYESLFDDDSTNKTSVDEDSTEYGQQGKKRNCIIGHWPRRKPVGLDQNVGLFVSPFVNGDAQQPSRLDDYSFEILVNDSWEKAVVAGKLEITLAYTLELFPLNPKPADLVSPVTTEDYSRARHQLKGPSRLPQLSEDPHLNFILWRNVEHILSVCSIPVRDGGDSDEVTPIALTCGDISSHLVDAKASL